MLSLRLAIVTVAAGLCLWGLFSLLDSLQEPGLLRSTKATAVKGCDSLESERAARLCPALFCQKALLDAKLLPLRASFEVAADRSEANRERLIVGRTRGGVSGDPDLYFACSLIGVQVVEAHTVDRDEFAELTGPDTAEDR
jgi:hypothetical protein